MRSALSLAWVIGAAALVADCSHAGRPCPPVQPFAPQPTPLAPSDPATDAAVAATGARYEICGGGATYVLAREGKRELTDGELRGVRTGLFLGGEGIDSAGIGGCGCPLAKSRLGIVAWVKSGAATPAALGDRLATLAAQAGGDPAVCLVVNTVSAPGPRCARGDPACGPVPYQAACVDKTHYDRDRKRTVVSAPGHRPSGPCSYDGECVVGGCGNDCLPTSQVPREGTCEEFDHWQEVYCGCVQAKCAWFTTK